MLTINHHSVSHRIHRLFDITICGVNLTIESDDSFDTKIGDHREYVCKLITDRTTLIQIDHKSEICVFTNYPNANDVHFWFHIPASCSIGEPFSVYQDDEAKRILRQILLGPAKYEISAK